MITVNLIIRKRRKELKKSAKDMALLLGVHVRRYYRMEAGHISGEEIERVCDLLGLDISYVPRENKVVGGGVAEPVVKSSAVTAKGSWKDKLVIRDQPVAEPGERNWRKV
jgi:transcriptional regulator with XRE-family HTH domain